MECSGKAKTGEASREGREESKTETVAISLEESYCMATDLYSKFFCEGENS